MSDRLKSFREMKKNLKTGHYFDYSRRKLSGSGKFKPNENKSTRIKQPRNLKLWSSYRSESSELPKRPKSNKKTYKTPFSPARKLLVVSARKVKQNFFKIFFFLLKNSF